MKVTPKDFFLWLGAMAALYGSAVALINLLFGYIEFAYPDRLVSYVDPFSGSIRIAMASLIVLAPLTIVLLRLIRADIAREPGKYDLWVRRWALVFTLFVAGATVIIDLITLINVFLGGELTVRFVLKVAVVLLVAGGIFLHFLADIRGYWREHAGKVHLVGYGAGLVVLLSILSGFVIIGTPGDIREARFDNERINDLSNIQRQVVSYWQQRESLPVSLEDLGDPLAGFVIPTDPETGEPYEYRRAGDLSFELCATFNRPSSAASRSEAPVPVREPFFDGQEVFWGHGEGEQCFERTIDPDRFPSLKDRPF